MDLIIIILLWCKLPRSFDNMNTLIIRYSKVHIHTLQLGADWDALFMDPVADILRLLVVALHGLTPFTWLL
jgi:hypothetical protein